MSELIDVLLFAFYEKEEWAIQYSTIQFISPSYIEDTCEIFFFDSLLPNGI